MNEKKRYWLKLDKNFLKSTHIKVIKNMPNGKDYIIFYLSLMLESVETIGHLRFSDLVPYNENMLASVTDTNIDIVRSAVKLFTQLGLMEQLDDGTIYMTQVAEMTGKESESAERVRQFRLRKEEKTLLGNTNVTNCNDNKEKQEERRKKKEDKQEEIEEQLIITTTNIYSYIEENYGRTLAPLEYEKIKGWLLLFEEDVIKYAIKLSVMGGKKTLNYTDGIIKNWQRCNYKTLTDIIDNENKKLIIKQTTPETKQLLEEIKNYNWLEDEDGE